MAAAVMAVVCMAGIAQATPITGNIGFSGAVQLNVIAKTNVTWALDLTLTVVSVGSGTAATLLGIGTLTSVSVGAAPLQTFVTALNTYVAAIQAVADSGGTVSTTFETAATAFAGAALPSPVLLPASAPAAGTGYDSTVANIVDLQGQFSITGNSMTLDLYELTLLG